jgi:DNA gyrase/topoisomerase IV subunit B
MDTLDIVKNEELATLNFILTGGRANIKGKFDSSLCKYSKIIIMADADTDGKI